MSEINLDPIVQNFVNKLEKAGGKPLYELTPSQARQVLLDVQKDIPENDAVQTDEYLAPLDDERKMKLYITKPVAATDPLPVIFYIHGGGWVMGGFETHRWLVEQISLRTNSAVVFPEYEQSPEAQYPQTTTDLFTTLQYVTEFGANFDLDISHLVVAGDSVGGNMAAVMTMMAKEQNNKPAITMQLLLYPVTDADFDSKSYHKFANGPWLTQKAMIWFWNNYAPDRNRQSEKLASILNADDEDLKDLPPALVITDENDVLRDEGEAYARKLSRAGVETVSVRINGTIHDFLMLYDLKDSPASQAAMDLITAFINKTVH